MYHVRKALVLVATTLLAMSLTASTASAQDIEVFPEVPVGDDCGTVELDVHQVTGGCHAEFEGHISLWVHFPAEAPFVSCHWHLEARLGADGEGYVTDAVFAPSTEPPLSAVCTRVPCDEPAPDHAFLPWPVHLVEAAQGDEIVEATFCVRPASSAEGASGIQCEVHLRLTETDDHQYEVGIGEGVHQFCEAPLPPISIIGHLTSVGEEAVEIVHHELEG